MKKLLLISFLLGMTITLYSYADVIIVGQNKQTMYENNKNVSISNIKNNRSKKMNNKNSYNCDSACETNIINEKMTLEQKKDSIKNFLIKAYSNNTYYTSSEITNFINEIINNWYMEKMLSEKPSFPKSTCIAFSKQMISIEPLVNSDFISDLWDEHLMNNFITVGAPLEQLGFKDFYLLTPSFVNENYENLLRIVNILTDNKISISAIECLFKPNDSSYANSYAHLSEVYQILKLMSASGKLNDKEIQVAFSNTYTTFKKGSWTVNYLTGTHDIDKYYDIITIYIALKRTNKQPDYTTLRKEYEKKVLYPLQKEGRARL